MRKRKGKRGMVLPTLAKWLIGALVLAVVAFGIVVLLGKGEAAVAFIEHLLDKFRAWG